MEVNCLDIETTGFAATDQLLSFTFGTEQRIQTNCNKEPYYNEQSILEMLSTIVKEQKDTTLITFNGQPKYGSMPGFDIPFLRTRYIVNKIPELYPFIGMQHIDVFEMIRALNTKIYTPPVPDDLSADQVTQLINVLGLNPAKTKKGNVTQLESIEDPKLVAEMNTYLNKYVESKPKEHNSLDSIYQLLFEDEPNEEEVVDDITGKDVPLIWAQYLIDEDEQHLVRILNHNLVDVRKTVKIFRCLEPMVTNMPMSIL